MLRSLLRHLHSGPIAKRMRRFALVGLFAASVQMVLLWLFVDAGGLHYLLGAFISIETTIILSYVLNNAWTFQAIKNTGTYDYVFGLMKTNVVRGTAIPIQLGILLMLVELRSVPYLGANAVAIGISGLYRYVLDAPWTWNR